VNVYPVLRDLEEMGLVRSSTEVIDSRARRTYELTATGTASVKRWLASRPESGLPKLADPLMLRLVLTTDSGGELEWPDDAIAELAAEYAEAAKRRRAFLERVLALYEQHPANGVEAPASR
jgi:DNA-binding PadR family transcriptional regulator